jgi:aspartyl-tRNA synthetase
MPQIIKNEYRTHSLGELTKKDAKKEVRLAGWVNSRRDHGGLIFVDLRDEFGITQVVFDPKVDKGAHKKAEALRNEWCLSVRGKVRERGEGLENPKLKTGEIEVEVKELMVVSRAKTPPFEIKDKVEVNEELRLKYRYLDLRRKKIRENLNFRAKVNFFTREWFTKKGFLEVETPLLSAPAPEGARDFLVPARREPGKFFALPQSPQIFKQFLMYSGVDKYFQISPAFRDEASRADRHVDVHYQLDVEMAFVKQEDIWRIYEDYLFDLVDEFGGKKKLLEKPLPQLTHKEALEAFGCDKPDLRFSLKLKTITEIAKKTDFNIFKTAEVIRVLRVPQDGEEASKPVFGKAKPYFNGEINFTRKEIDDLMQLVQSMGAAGLAWTKINNNGEAEQGIAKFLNQDFLSSIKAKPGDTLFFAADTQRDSAKYLDAVRSKIAEIFKLADPNLLAYAWIKDFYLFDEAEEGAQGMSQGDLGVQFAHNPFTNPAASLEELKTAKQKGKKELLKIKAKQFDCVCNGMEMFSGGERCTDPEMLSESFQAVGYPKEEVKTNFGPILEAFSYGPPPHGGFGQGVDRLLMLLKGEENVRELTAFPKTSTCQDLMLNAPRSVTEEQLEELGIEIKG